MLLVALVFFQGRERIIFIFNSWLRQSFPFQSCAPQSGGRMGSQGDPGNQE
jgi:hypothetical protein